MNLRRYVPLIYVAVVLLAQPSDSAQTPPSTQRYSLATFPDIHLAIVLDTATGKLKTYNVKQAKTGEFVLALTQDEVK